MVDAGLDLGKTEPQSLVLLRESDRLAALGYPVFLSASNKRFLGHLLGTDVTDRNEATTAAHALGIALGCRILRAHDVRAARRVGAKRLTPVTPPHRAPQGAMSLSMPAGSTWWRSRSAFWRANASTGASKASRVWLPRPPPGRNDATPNEPASNGCSQLKKPAPRWREPTRSPRPNQPGPASKNQNLCDEVLVL